MPGGSGQVLLIRIHRLLNLQGAGVRLKGGVRGDSGSSCGT